MILCTIERGWWRWHVYHLGNAMNDRTWLASFRYKQHAQTFVEVLRFGWVGHPPDDPINHLE
jgi:hypothetical protein